MEDNIIKATFKFNKQNHKICATTVNQIRLIIQDILKSYMFIPFSENRKEIYYVGKKKSCCYIS